MHKYLFYPAGCTPASHAAARFLQEEGIALTDHITPEATHLLLDVPSFSPSGLLKSGARPEALLSLLPEQIIPIGGLLPEAFVREYSAVDLLKEEGYLFENAALTAECALRVASEKIPFSLRGAQILIVGWGRIGKQLALLLKAHRSEVSILSRSAAHRAEAEAFGLRSVAPEALAAVLPKCRIIFNTAPGRMISGELSRLCEGCLKIDLAFKPGIEAGDVVSARGLPGIHVPESSGQLIAKTIVRMIQEGRL